MGYALRARFKEEILAEFLPPKKPSKKVVILCDGLPTVPSKRRLLDMLSCKGYWVIHPRFRGTWESYGTFLDHDPTQDIIDIIDELPKGFTSIWDKVSYKVEPESIHVLGASFGGTAAILSTLDPRVNGAVALSPVVDWSSDQLSSEEPMDWLEHAVKEAFGPVYRFAGIDWDRLSRGELYNPMSHIPELDKKKIYIIHTLDDKIVLPGTILSFIKKLGCASTILKSGGHVPKKVWTNWFLRRKIFSFLSQTS